MHTALPPQDLIRALSFINLILPLLGLLFLGPARKKDDPLTFGVIAWTCTLPLTIYATTLQLQIPAHTPGLIIWPGLQAAWGALCATATAAYILRLRKQQRLQG